MRPVGGALLARPAEELGAALPGAQLLGQLIPALIAIELILGLIDRLRLRQDLPGDLRKSRVDSRLAFPAIFVPSIATTPGLTSPASAHSPST